MRQLLIFALFFSSQSVFAARENLKGAPFSVQFDEKKWQVTARDEEKGAEITHLRIENASEQVVFAVFSPRVGNRVRSLRELAERYAVQVDESPSPSFERITFLKHEAILVTGTATRKQGAAIRSRAIVVLFAGGEEWAFFYSCSSREKPTAQSILSLVSLEK